MKAIHLLSMDLGASSGRAMLGAFDGQRISLREVHRFPNEPVSLLGHEHWDVLRLHSEIKSGLGQAAQIAPISSMGIDTWGVDFGLLDTNGQLLANPYHYRDPHTEGIMDVAFETLSKEDIFAQTGLAFLQFNTIYQLLAMQRANSIALANAKTLLFMPDLLAYFLTGEMGCEQTIASTSQLLSPLSRSWSQEILSAFSLDASMFAPLQAPGSMRGVLLPSIMDELSIHCPPIPVANVGSHDTASAVAAVPAHQPGFAYLSSGTWSLLGTELATPLLSPAVMQANYTNEGGVFGTTRLLKNIMGLWILQECKRQWEKEGTTLTFDEMVQAAETAPAFACVIDVDDPSFLPRGNMPARIVSYCQRTGQIPPQTQAEFVRAVLEGLALKYRESILQLEEMTQMPITALHIVGGGSKNALLNQMTADALGRPVIAGPSEATAVGALLMQAVSLGEIGDIWQLRDVVRASFETQEFLPNLTGTSMWEDAAARVTALV